MDFVLRTLFAFTLLCVPALGQYVGYDPSTRIDSRVSAIELRSEVTEAIFGGSLDTSNTPVYFSTFNPAGTVWAGSANMAAIQEWRSTTSKGLVSRQYRFVPHTLRSPASGFILASGHGQIGTYPPYDTMIKSLVSKGYEVWTVDMPLSGLNAATSVVDGPFGGKVLVTSHDTMAVLQTPDYNPIRLFLEPTLAIVNSLELRGFTYIGMSGLSGGGWLTALYMALDTRIDAGYSVAGSMPFYVRSWAPPHSSVGDWEQMAVAALGVDYTDLYILAAMDRSFTNIHIVSDPCCFGGYAANHYHDFVSGVASSLGGTYETVFDTTTSAHTVSPWAQSLILSRF